MHDFPKFVDGQTAIAKIIATACGIRCHRQYIVKWLKPTKNRPEPFPKANDANRYDVAACIAWVEKYKKELGGDSDEAEMLKEAALAVARTKIRNDEIQKFRFEVEQQKYVLRKEAEISAIGVAKRFQALTRDAIRATFLELGNVARGEALIDELDAKYAEAAIEQ